MVAKATNSKKFLGTSTVRYLSIFPSRQAESVGARTPLSHLFAGRVVPNIRSGDKGLGKSVLSALEIQQLRIVVQSFLIPHLTRELTSSGQECSTQETASPRSSGSYGHSAPSIQRQVPVSKSEGKYGCSTEEHAEE